MPTIPSSRRQVGKKVFTSQGVSSKAPVEQHNLEAVTQLAGIVDKGLRQSDARERLQSIERNKAEDVELNALETRFRDKQMELTHSEERGFRNVQGINTTKELDAYNLEYNSFVNKEIASLGSESLRAKAAAIGDSFVLDADKFFNDHTYREMRKYDDAQTQTNLKSIQDYAVLHYDTRKIGESLQRQKNIIEKYTERKGMSPAQTKEMKLNASSSLNHAVISRALHNGEYGLAKEYFKQTKDNMNGETVAILEKVLHVSSVAASSQAKTDEIMAIENLSLGGALKIARKIKDPEVRDAVVRRVTSRYTEEEGLRADQMRVRAKSIKEEVDRHKSIKGVSQEEQLQLSKEKRELTLEYAKLISEGYSPRTDILVRQELNQMAADPRTRNKYMKLDMTDYMMELSPAEFAKQEAQQIKVAKDDAVTEEALNTQYKETEIVAFEMAKLEIEDDNEKLLIKGRVMEDANEWRLEHKKKKVPNKVIKEMVADAVYAYPEPSRFAPPGWFSYTDQGFELPRAEYESKRKKRREKEVENRDKKLSDTYNKIPKNLREQFEESYNRRHKGKLTKEMVLKMYLNHVSYTKSGGN